MPVSVKTADEIVKAEEYDAAGQHDDAVNMLARATKAGDVEAMTRLGKRLVVGDRAPLLPQDGARFLIDAAKQGSAEAAGRLAVLVAAGAYVKQSWNDAFNILLTAAERGWAPAQGQLRALSADRARAQEAGNAETVPADIWRRLATGIDFSVWNSSPEGNTLNEAPLIRNFSGFLSREVCAWLIETAQGRLERARVYDSLQGAETVHSTRTNTLAGFNLMTTDLVHLLAQSRMAAACKQPFVHFEGTTVLHYDIGEEIANHYDFVDPKIPNYDEEIAQNGQRVITFLVYLNDDYQGGETEFPKLGISHKGALGEGLYFVNALADGSPDLRTVHAGRPPRHGEKWLLTQFIRNRPVLPVAQPSA